MWARIWNLTGFTRDPIRGGSPNPSVPYLFLIQDVAGGLELHPVAI